MMSFLQCARKKRIESSGHSKDRFDRFGKFVICHHGTKLQESSLHFIEGNYEHDSVQVYIKIKFNRPANA